MHNQMNKLSKYQCGFGKGFSNERETSENPR